MDHLVSIIVPNYNHSLYLDQRLKSIFKQTYQNFEVILLDDSSTDNSLEQLKKFKAHPKVSHLIVNKQNSGSPFKQWEKGIKLAKGEYIWVAESDDFSSILFLSKVMEAFKHCSKPDVVFVGTTNINEFNIDIGNNSRIEKKYKMLLSKDFSIKGNKFLKFFLPNYCVIRNVSSAVFKKSVAIRGVSNVTKFKVVGDFYFWLYLCSKDCSFLYMSEKFNFMRNHSKTVRRNKNLAVIKEKEYKKIHLEVILRNFFNVNALLIIIKHYFKKK